MRSRRPKSKVDDRGQTIGEDSRVAPTVFADHGSIGGGGCEVVDEVSK